MGAIAIPQSLIDAVRDDDIAPRYEWLSALPGQVAQLAAAWELELGEPYLPGGQCAWVAPAVTQAGADVVLKVSWRHPEAEHEADALKLWDGDGAVRCLDATTLANSTALLLERCAPGMTLGSALAEREQDPVIAGLLRRLWEHEPPPEGPFGALEEMCAAWADSFERDFESDARGLDPGLANGCLSILRELPARANRRVVLCTDLHAGNALASQREPWLVIDPKPYVGDAAYDAVQHMLNCDRRLEDDPAGMADRMADLLDVDRERVRLWLFARCAQEALHDRSMRQPAAVLARAI